MHRFPPNPPHRDRLAAHPQSPRLADLDDPFELGVAAAEMGTWDWDIPSGHLRWTPQMYLLFGTEAGRFTTTFENVMELIHPEDRPRVEAHVASAVRELRRSAIEFRIRRPDGGVRWLRVRCRRGRWPSCSGLARRA